MGKPRLLILDDDIDILNELNRFLEQDFSLSSVNTIDAALDGIHSANPRIEVLVTDMRMPGNSKAGIRVAEEIVGLADRPKVIVLTAFPDLSDVNQTMRVGAFAYVEKGKEDSFDLLRDRCFAASQRWRVENSSGRPRLLIFDDDPITLYEYSEFLSPDFDVLTCKSIDEGLAILTDESSIDVVVSDMKIPGDRRAGIHFAREILALPGPPAVVICSGYKLMTDTNELLELGVFGVVEKGTPDTYEQLRATCLSACSSAPSPPIKRRNSTNIFISYCHDDTRYKNELEKHLEPLKRNRDVNVWTDSSIMPGEEWRQKIESAIDEADIFVFLVTVNFLGSSFCTDVELARSIVKYGEKRAKIIGVLVDDCLWGEVEIFARLQMIPQDKQGKLKSVASSKNRNSAWTEIAKSIAGVVTSIK